MPNTIPDDAQGKNILNMSIDTSKKNGKTCDVICPICMDNSLNPIIASCGHVFCWSCIYKWYKMKKHNCPQCKSYLSLNDTIRYTENLKISKFTKPVRLVCPSYSNDTRPFGSNSLCTAIYEENYVRILMCIVGVTCSGLFVIFKFIFNK